MTRFGPTDLSDRRVGLDRQPACRRDEAARQRHHLDPEWRLTRQRVAGLYRQNKGGIWRFLPPDPKNDPAGLKPLWDAALDLLSRNDDSLDLLRRNDHSPVPLPDLYELGALGPSGSKRPAWSRSDRPRRSRYPPAA